MTQIFIALFGLGAIWMAMGTDERLHKWAPIVGLAGQPFWAAFAWETRGWGLGALVVAYTAVYLRGAWVQWEARRWLWRKFGTPSETRCIGCGRELTPDELHHYVLNCERCAGIAMQEMEDAA